MYHDEAIIDGNLCWRDRPDGEWRIVQNAPHVAVVAELLKLTDEQRLAAFRLFCSECGRIQTSERGCQCWNDE